MLFALMNGDDMYPTFRAFSPTDSLSVYVYSRFFVYIFVSLFLYAVLNLFTSLVISSYEYSQVNSLSFLLSSVCVFLCFLLFSPLLSSLSLAHVALSLSLSLSLSPLFLV